MQIGYRLMREDGNVFTCYNNMWDTIFYSELGSSLAVLKGGYNLDSFMVRYQGVDWTDQSSWECNGRRALVPKLRLQQPLPVFMPPLCVIVGLPSRQRGDMMIESICLYDMHLQTRICNSTDDLSKGPLLRQARRFLRRVNPYGENYYDGISLNPFEVMFVKVKGVLLQNDWSYARVAKKYDEWMTMQARRELDCPVLLS